MSLSLIYQCQCQRALLTSRAMSSFVEMPHSLRRRAVSRRLRAQRRRAIAVSLMRKPPDRRGPPRENRRWLCLLVCLGLCPLCGIGRRGSGASHHLPAHIRDALAPDFLTLEPGQGYRLHISVRHVLDAQRAAGDLKHLDDVFRAVPAKIAQGSFVIEVIGCHHRLLPKRRVALVFHDPFFHDCGSFWRARRAIPSTASLRMPYSSKVMNSACSSTRTNALRARRIMS